jgi:cytochrome c nitrite reductase small subunit
LQNNCIRCHETTVMVINTDRQCWNCHKRISHIHTGIRKPFKGGIHE